MSSISQALFNLIFKIFFFIVGLIGSIIIYPIQVLLVSIIPGLGNFITTVANFLYIYILPIVSFIKEAFIEITHVPRELLSIFFGFIIARWLIAPTIRALKLVLSIWKLKSGGSTK